MSMALVGGAIGASLGSMVGMPQLGWMLGSMIGGTFDPTKNTQGPRLGDTRVQLSTYGKPIPQIFGTARIAGNVIWSSGLIETAHTASGGGKGGGGGTSQTNYTYAASFAVGVCSTTSPDGTNTPITGIGKIWADGQLIANFGSIDPNTVLASYANGGGKNGDGVGYQASGGSVLYTGSETQNPDPTMQAYLGAVNVPAYRGQAYIVFNNFQLQKFGNRIPNIEFEVIVNGTFTSTLAQQSISNSTCAQYPLQMSKLHSSAAYFGVSGQLSSEVSIYSLANKNAPAFLRTLYSAGNVQPKSYVYGSNIAISGPIALIYNCVNGLLIAQTTVGTYADVRLDASYLYGIDTVTNSLRIASAATGQQVANFAIGSAINSFAIFGNYIFISGGGFLYCVDVTTRFAPTLLWSLSLANSNVIETDGAYLYLTFSNTVAAYKLNGGGVPTFLSSVAVNNFNVWNISLSGSYIFVGSSSPGIQVVDARSPSNLRAIVSQSSAQASYAAVSLGNYFYYAGYPGGTRGSLYTYFLSANVITSTGVTAAAMLSNICAQVGVSSLDTSQLTDVCDGYIIGSQMSARAAIEPLQKAFYFDAVETDNVIRFAKRGIQPITIIPEDDLAAHAPSTKVVPSAINLSHAQEMELPALVNVAYYNKGNAYQQGSQYAKRQTVASRQTLDLQLPMCMTDAHAKQISEVNLFVAWTQKNTVSFSTTRKYAYLDPSDVVQVTRASGAIYTLLITKRTEAAGGIINWEAVVDDASIYSQVSAASSGLVIQADTVALAGNTHIEFLDIPLLRDADDATGSGYYTAAGGYDSGWAGGALFKSSDSGATYANAGGLPTPGAIMGAASTALSNFSGGNVFDELNQVTVVIETGQLSSVTTDQVLNGANAAVIGNEIIQFRDAVLIAANTYTLGGLLRGRFGTEQRMTAHAAGDRFVVLDVATMQRQTAAINEIGLVRTYKAATTSQLLSACSPITFTDNATGLKPLSPVQIGGGRDAAGTLIINWARRTRIGGGWNNFADVPLGETSESYSIDIMLGTVVKRTLTSSAQTVNYTSAMQVTDFGSNQGAVLVNIYQISATIGRGFAGIATI